MTIENEPKSIKTFSEIEQEMMDKGFTYAGYESLTRFAFGGNTKFQTIPLQTR